ncbi:hypothetical protein BDZ94DRAFT_460960 [Collybia nuda]|uniref:Uncharacterized protein n=1 Tax=Collybia nuda TaxID=64659 RepID=A0A9P5YBM1_9AGAR|nr:hypothetical protein BDZ94DRAFT_460960 [Collybia nuda]
MFVFAAKHVFDGIGARTILKIIYSATSRFFQTSHLITRLNPSSSELLHIPYHCYAGLISTCIAMLFMLSMWNVNSADFA